MEADGSKGILTITGTDVRTHIQRRLRLEHIEESGSIILPPILAEMLYLLADEFVELESERNLVTLRSGACQYTISGLAAKSFPKLQIPFPEDTIQVKGINSLIRRTVFAANGDNIDYNRAGFSYVKISFSRRHGHSGSDRWKPHGRYSVPSLCRRRSGHDPA